MFEQDDAWQQARTAIATAPATIVDGRDDLIASVVYAIEGW